MQWLSDTLTALVSALPVWLPEPAVRITSFVLVGLGVVYVAWRFIDRFRNRRRIYIDEIESGSVSDGEWPVVFRNRLARTIEEALRGHERDSFEGSGETTNLSEPQLSKEGAVDAVMSVTLESSTTLGFVNRVPDLLWPRFRLTGNLHVQDGRLFCHVVLRRGSRPLAMFTSEFAEPGAEAVVEGAGSIAYQALFYFASSPRLNKGAVLGTRNWYAFQAHSQAMHLLSEAGNVIDPDDFERITTLLRESRESDPEYALPWYNYGVLLHRGQRDRARVERALECFQKARDLAAARRSVTELAERKASERVLVRALCGIAQCYAQRVHRYDEMREADLEHGRAAAERAYELDRKAPIVLYALAFAYGCTDKFEDIERAIPLYERLVEKYPGQFAKVHNNLCYNYMKGAVQLRQLGEAARAEEWLAKAVLHGEAARRAAKASSTVWRYAGANLGAVARLQQRFDDALKLYETVLGPAPATSTYVEGLNEYAWVLFSIGVARHDVDATARGLRFHRLALQRAKDPDHAWKQVLKTVEYFGEEGDTRFVDLTNFVDVLRDLAPEERHARWLDSLEAMLTSVFSEAERSEVTPAAVALDLREPISTE
jgi:tetratricopeptide (TPR) repeat protein